MSNFGGMDRGVPGDAPFLGRTVIYQETDGDFQPAVVTAIREDGWTVTLSLFATNTIREFVPYGGNVALGVIPVGAWVTPDEYEGWKIYAAERAETANIEKGAANGEEEDGRDD
jgi:hypothetical protein